MSIVSREEFLSHLNNLIEGLTDIPCTVEAPYPTYDAATGRQMGNVTISYFVNFTPQWMIDQGNPRLRHVDCNHSGAGRHWGVRLAQFGGYEDEVAVIEEEEGIAREKGVTLVFVIGKKSDPYSISQRGDPPGIDL